MAGEQREVIKSTYDTRDYKVITLKNEITALLISDQSKEARGASHSGEDAPNTSDKEDDSDDGNGSSAGSCDEGSKQSAAALCVGVGSFSDPQEVQGLAHFLEHMVFMGSTKYPGEKAFDEFVSSNGGYSNASTDCERTTFQFSVPRKHFRKGLDMFANFFVHPLLDPSSMESEIEAVDSEFYEVSQKDGNRLQQLLSDIAKDNYPMAKFLWGNKVSLKEKPNEQGISVYEKIKQFHNQYYRSKYMTLAVISQDSLDDLENWVTDSFDQVPNCDQPHPTFSNLPDPFDNSFYRLYKVSPIKDTHELRITWCLPPLQRYYKVKPLDYISWLMGHEGTGSIMALLKKKYYATSVDVDNDGKGFQLNTSYSLFRCCITLTEKGYDNIVECCSIVFQYIKMLRSIGVDQSVFKEIQSIEEREFKFRESEDPVDYVEWVSEAMQLYPSKHYLTGDALLFDYKPEVIKDVQDMLNPAKANIAIISPLVSDECTLQEQWFGTEYCVQDVPNDWMEQWKSLPPHPGLHLPSRNQFTPTDFELKTIDQDVNSKYPKVINDRPQYKLWFKQDDMFQIPRAYVYLHFITPLPSYSPESSALLDLMIEVLLYNFAEDGYQAKMAGISYSLEEEKSGLVVMIDGFNHKIHLLLETLIKYMMSCNTTEDTFNIIKGELKKAYKNSTIKAKKLSKLTRLNIIEYVNWSTFDILKVIDGISLAKFKCFIQQFKRELFVEALIQGNVTSQEAKSMMDSVTKHLNYQPLPSCMRPQFRTMQLPRKQLSLWQQYGDSNSPNTAIVNYYQCCCSDIKANTLTQLLMHCMEEPCFDVLRDKNKLGYDVGCSHDLTNGILGFSVSVLTQADKFSAKEASNKMLQFVNQFCDTLSEMSDSTFEDHVVAMTHNKLEQDNSLEQEVTRHWEEIMSQEYVFDRCDREVTILNDVKQNDLISWFKRNTKGDEDLRLLSVQILGHGKKKDQSQDGTDGGVITIADINKFKQSLSVYPVTKTTS